MKKFVITATLFSIIFFCIDKLFYIILARLPSFEDDKRLELVLKGNVNKEIIIMGSSRGADNIIAGQLSVYTGLSTYNLSYSGSDIEFHLFVLETLLKYNKKPSILVLAVDSPMELLYSKSLKYRYDRLYPLAKYNFINETLIDRHEKSIVSRYLVLGRLSKESFSTTKKTTAIVNPMLYCGSSPFIKKNESAIFDYNKGNVIYSSQKELKSKKRAFINFQKLCKKNKINLIFAFSPNFKKFDKKFETRIRYLSNYDIPFFIYDTTKSIYKDKSYFYDESHLNIKGAKIFTAELGGFMLLEKKKNKLD